MLFYSEKNLTKIWIRLRDEWVYGGFLAALLLLALTPTLSREWSSALLLIWLQLPMYMLHQYEEHEDDRFRRFVNHNIGGGKEVLTRGDVFIINIFGVWGVDSVGFILAQRGHLGLGLICVYLSLVNGLGHTIQAIAQRKYNPGLITSILFFIPMGVVTLIYLAGNSEVSAKDHIIGLVLSLCLHAGIIARVVIRKQALPHDKGRGLSATDSLC